MRGRKGYAIYGVYACQLGHNRAIEIAAYVRPMSGRSDAIERQCMINDLSTGEGKAWKYKYTGMNDSSWDFDSFN